MLPQQESQEINSIVWFYLDFRHRFFLTKKNLGVLAPSCTHCCPLLASCPSLGGVTVATARWIWRMEVKLEIVVLKGGSNFLASPIASIQTSMCTVFCMSDINLYCRRFTLWKVTSKLANGVSRFQVFVKLLFFRLHIAKGFASPLPSLTSSSYIPSGSGVCSVRSGPFGVIGGVYGGLLSHGVWALRVFIRVECWIPAKVMQDFSIWPRCLCQNHTDMYTLCMKSKADQFLIMLCTLRCSFCRTHDAFETL